MNQILIDELRKDGFEVGKETETEVIMKKNVGRNKVELVQIKNGISTGNIIVTEAEAKAILS